MVMCIMLEKNYCGVGTEEYWKKRAEERHAPRMYRYLKLFFCHKLQYSILSLTLKVTINIQIKSNKREFEVKMCILHAYISG